MSETVSGPACERCRTCGVPIVARENRPENDDHGPYVHVRLTQAWYDRPHDAFPRGEVVS